VAAMSKRRRVALYIDIRGSYDHGIARGVIRYAKERRNWNLFGHGWTLNEIGNPERWTGDGIIARIRKRDETEALMSLGVPVVDVAQSFMHPQLNYVANDDFETGRAAGAYLRQCGFRRFAFCGVADGGLWSELRYQGYVAGSEAENGIVAQFENPFELWERPGTSAQLRRWLKSLPLPIGILASNDTIGVKITAACQAEGLSIPTDVAVLGVDNEDVLCELANPTLSSVPCDCERMGYEAARLLDRLMKRRREPLPPVRIPPLPIVVRASTDVLAIDDELVTQALRFIRNSKDLTINVNDVMRAVPASRRSLETRFRKIVGRTIHDEIRRVRLENACRLLVGTDQPVAKIALTSGFSSHRRFHVVFCEHMKMLPSKYREMRRSPAGRNPA
jgi:LacI family transcriptional regulator